MWWRVLIGQKDHLDVKLCEDPSHCLRETMDVGQGYSVQGLLTSTSCLCR